ncbi:CubicO group peptidase (beta-lactamase class C family) [Nonomuraea thailandensis]|uniref:CubicO group peptidase (Beta-lactamase class C family) n=1 Tax=Nonomuraea thailandensis TaxID=1188745 RepID=A0A9X2GIJ3_9ACTN|nr:serine hydrolase domain-containing protein [Nonomuraea thailandensis]MCP2354748.1 CubicO group peptidase (beta-lactamase class C family) [Nonomuraea thailandensis]
MTDRTADPGAPLDELVRRAVEQLAEGRRGAVAVGAIRGEETATHGAEPHTLFQIGSITKTFTALTLARLAGRGEVAFDQPLRELLPDGAAVPLRDGRQVELGHLACHTSGLPRLPKGLMPRGMFSSDPYAGCTEEVLMDGLRRTRLRSVPGSRFHYSNLGGGLLGLALARQAGLDYDELVQRELCRPLGLADTRVELDGERAARLAPGHSRFGRPRPGWRLAALAGAGGLHSTVPDLLRLAGASFGDGPAEITEAVALTRATGHSISKVATAHPGWLSMERAQDKGGPRVLFHNGGTGGYRSLLAMIPERRAAVVALSANARSVDAVGMRLLSDLAGRSG